MNKKKMMLVASGACVAMIAVIVICFILIADSSADRRTAEQDLVALQAENEGLKAALEKATGRKVSMTEIEATRMKAEKETQEATRKHEEAQRIMAGAEARAKEIATQSAATLAQLNEESERLQADREALAAWETTLEGNAGNLERWRVKLEDYRQVLVNQGASLESSKAMLAQEQQARAMQNAYADVLAREQTQENANYRSRMERASQQRADDMNFLNNQLMLLDATLRAGN